MYEVMTREIPQRSLLCLKRNVSESGLWALGKEFVGIVGDQRLPRIGAREGAAFCIYWGQVSADSDGPVEWRRPVPSACAPDPVTCRGLAWTLIAAGRSHPGGQQMDVAGSRMPV